MSKSYDMCVNYNTLTEIEEKLNTINASLLLSVDEMDVALHQSDTYLSGNQYDKARKTTALCINETKRTYENIKSAETYIDELKRMLEEYGKCTFEEVKV